MQKRGLSTIVASVLIILLVIIAVGIVWAFLKPSILKSIGDADSSLLTVNMKIEKASIQGNNLSVKILREAGKGKVDKIRIVISNETDNQILSISRLDELESRVYTITTIINNATKIEIAPVLVKDDKEIIGLKADKYILRKTTSNEITIPQPPPGCNSNEECTTSEQCKNTPGTCDIAAGTCSFTNKFDYSSCTSCGASCWCKSGDCVNMPLPSCSSGLLGYWKFNEGSGLITSDSKGGHNGNLIGASWTSGKLGGAIQFDGVNDYIDVGNIPLQNNFTISAWVKLKKLSGFSYGYPMVFCKGYTNTEYLLFVETEWRFRTMIGGVNNFVVSTSDANESWTMVTGRYNSTTLSIFVNGTEEGGYITSGNVNDYGYNLNIGACSISNYGYLNGTIDEVSIWNRTLTAEEIKSIYNFGQGKELC